MKNIKKVLAAGLLVITTLGLTACSNQPANQTNQANQEEVNNMTTMQSALSIHPTDDYFIFELAENVNRTAVSYTNRYGIEIAADLYTAKDLDENQQYPALVIGPPYGGVKEQGPGVYANGEPAYSRNYPTDAPLEELPDNITGLNVEWWTFYGLQRGWHPNAGGSFTNTSMLPFANYPLLNHIDSISPRPILFVTGDIAHSKAFSEDAYAAAAEPKELYVVPGAMHIDLYDDVSKIPFDKLESFFKEAFAE